MCTLCASLLLHAASIMLHCVCSCRCSECVLFLHPWCALTCAAALGVCSCAQARKQVILEAERQKLLAEAAELKDYLPRGVLRDQADIDYINSVLAGTNLNGH